MATRNRGKQSSDDRSFAPDWLPVFTEATDDLCFLLTRGYSENSALELVGNRYRFNKRQRNALGRIGCSNQLILTRGNTRCEEAALEGQTIEIDGFNLLILLESALSGAYIFKGRDGLYRDISSVHGSYHRVMKTGEAIHMAGDFLKKMKVRSVTWYLDQPVSNSGRLKTQLLEISRLKEYGWEVQLVNNPDKVLAVSKNIIISSDGWILDHAERWYNLAAMLIENEMEGRNIITV